MMFQLAGAPAQAATPPADRGALPVPGTPSDGEYEIDYEEEEGASAEAVPEAPEPLPVKGKKRIRSFGVGPAVQGSRAKNRFVPILKSETRSVYQKDGRPLDVDTD